jgi:hypothetical protein
MPLLLYFRTEQNSIFRFVLFSLKRTVDSHLPHKFHPNCWTYTSSIVGFRILGNEVVIFAAWGWNTACIHCVKHEPIELFESIPEAVLSI